jgi:hypothetical protein
VCAHVAVGPAFCILPLDRFPTCNCQPGYNNGRSGATHHHLPIWNRCTRRTCRPPGARRRTRPRRPADRSRCWPTEHGGVGAWASFSFDLESQALAQEHAHAGAGNYHPRRTSVAGVHGFGPPAAPGPAITSGGCPARACGYQLIIVVFTSNGIFHRCHVCMVLYGLTFRNPHDGCTTGSGPSTRSCNKAI